MQKRRLLKLADLLEKDAKNKKGIKFDMTDWGTMFDVKKPLSCDTRACAMGLAALSGAFKRQGLTYGFVMSGDEHDVGCTRINFEYKGRRTNGFSAAERLFEISMREAEYLFSPGNFDDRGGKGEREAAKRIRDFVRDGIP